MKTKYPHGSAARTPYSPEDLEMIRESFGMNIPEFALLLSRPGAVIHRNTWRKWELGEQQIPAAGQCLVAMLLHMRQHAQNALEEWIDGAEKH